MLWELNNFKNNIAAITQDGQKISYDELHDYSNQLIQNIKDRCLVFSLCSNTLGSLIGYIAFQNNHTVPLLLSENLESALLNNLIETYKPDYIYLPNTSDSNISNCQEIYSDFGYRLLKTKYHREYKLHDDLALLLATSGSTGSPKLVRQSYNNIRSNTKSIIKYLNINEKQKAITTLPMNYSYGASIVNTHISAGASLLLTDKAVMQKEFWQQLKEFQCTSFGGVPYTYEMLDRLRFYRMDLPSLQYMTQAGGKLSPDLQEKFAHYAIENNKNFFVMYGQTEATARMSYICAQQSLEKPGSIGKAVPGGQFSLIDKNGEEITNPNQVGELVYIGDNVTLGYAESGEDLSLGDQRNRKLMTADMAKCDDDGFYYIVGRKKRFLKIFGNRINLDETERLIKAEFDNLECACTGIDDKMSIYITNDNLEKNIKDFISKKTGLNHSAFKIHIIDSIPKNEAGKTLYKDLEERHVTA